MLNSAQKLFYNPFLIFALVGLYPAVFLASKNWSMYTGYQIWCLIICTPLGTLIAGSVCYGLVLVVSKSFLGLFKFKNTTIRIDVFKQIWVGIISCLFFVFLLQSSIFVFPKAISIVLVCVLFVFLLLVKTGYAPLSIMLSGMTLIAASECYTSYRNNQVVKNASCHTGKTIIYENIVLRNIPNVYLFHLESYQSPEAMREIYGYDNRDFCSGLENRNFSIFDSHFSNYYSTLYSMRSLFDMEHHYYTFASGNMDVIGAREFIGGKIYDPTLQIFSNNGYKYQIVHETDYCFIPGDTLDYVYPRWPVIKVLEIFQINVINRIISKWCCAYMTPNGLNILQTPEGTLESIMEERIGVVSHSTVPYFSFFSVGGTSHSINEKSWENLKSFEQEYIGMVKHVNPRILRLMDSIINQDPDAIIILYGDHGARRYNKIWKGSGDLNSILQSKGISGRVVALDLFGSFLAVRYPGGNARKLGESTHINLFRNLFSDLSGDNSILYPPAENHAYFKSNGRLYIAVKEGTPLDKWEVKTVSSSSPLKSPNKTSTSNRKQVQ